MKIHEYQGKAVLAAHGVTVPLGKVAYTVAEAVGRAPDVVVGKPIDEVRVSRLAGSSGTPDGFNEAIEKIKGQASP